MSRLLIAVLALLIPLDCAAGPSWGVEGGLGYVWLSDDLEIEGRDPGARLDLNLAAVARFELNPAWSVFTGLRYSRLGNKVEYESMADAPFGSGSPGTSSLHYHYVGVPVIGRWTHTTSGPAAPFLFAGAEFAHLVKSTIDFEVEDGVGGSDETETTDDMSRINATAVIGAGVAITKSDHSVDVSIRCAYGLVDTLEAPGLSWLTREITLTLGFRR